MEFTRKLELFKERMKFSAGHFTIFSASERENLHGHNFQVQVNFELRIGDNGMGVPYQFYKNLICDICDSVDETFLLPGKSPYLTIEEEKDCIYAFFNDEKIPFLKRDVKILPIVNTTVEELSLWFLKEIKARLEDKDLVTGLEVKVGSGAGQYGVSSYRA